MTKEEVLRIFENKGGYTWHLYFFSVNRRINNPYKFQKVRMTGSNNIITYTHNLISNVYSYINSQVEDIVIYSGDNPKLSCESVSLVNSILSDEWDKFVNGIVNATDNKLEDKIKGYIVVGKLKEGEVGPDSISLVKIADPSVNLKDKKSVVFRKTNVTDDEFTLKEMNELMYRLYLSVDMFTIEHEMFVLNYKFESFFNLEKTFEKIKNEKAALILNSGSITGEIFEKYINRYPSHRTFLTFSDERFEKVNDPTLRISISEKYKFNLDEDGNFSPLDNEEAKRLIQYLCYKLIEDGDTNEILQVSGVSKLEL